MRLAPVLPYITLNITHYGKWQPSGCQWHSRKHQGGEMPHLHSIGFAPETSYLPLLPPTPWEFQVMRQGKTLAMAWALQTWAEASGNKTGILCEAARELQQCMAPLMTLNGDNIVEASLVRLTWEELGSSPTPEEEPTLLSKDDELSEVPGPTPDTWKSLCL